MEEKIYCKYCGESIDADSQVCPKCGKHLTGEIPVQIQAEGQPKWLSWLTWLSIVFCPVLGLILIWAANKDLPKAKKILLTIICIIWAPIYYSPKDGSDNNTAKVAKNNAVKVTVADFSTMNESSANDWCTTNKLNCRISAQYSDTVAKDALIRQSEAAGSSVSEGSSLVISYSMGKEPSIEFKNALKKAESYSEHMHMSKKGIFEQLTSSYGEGFPKDAAQYAVDNLKADYKKNALEKAKSYSEHMNMSKNAIFEQLMSDYGEKFTRDEAQYAVDNLYK